MRRWCMYSGILREAKAKSSSFVGSNVASAKTLLSSVDPQIGHERPTRCICGMPGPWKSVVAPRFGTIPTGTNLEPLSFEHIGSGAQLAFTNDAASDEVRSLLHLLEDLGDVLPDQRHSKEVDPTEEEDP